MNYDEIRDKIQSGDVIAFSHTGLASWGDFESQLVRVFTRSEYTHVAIAWPIGGRVLLIEAAVPKVRIYPLSHYKEFYWIPMDLPLSSAALEAGLDIIGQDYSKFEAIKALLSDPINSNRKWQCAEVVKYILRENGTSLFSSATPSNIVKELLSDFNKQLFHVRV